MSAMWYCPCGTMTLKSSRICLTCGAARPSVTAEAEVGALRRVASAARAVEAKMTATAREYNCDIEHDEHEQLRSALHNLDMLVTTSAPKDE